VPRDGRLSFLHSKPLASPRSKVTRAHAHSSATKGATSVHVSPQMHADALARIRTHAHELTRGCTHSLTHSRTRTHTHAHTYEISHAHAQRQTPNTKHRTAGDGGELDDVTDYFQLVASVLLCGASFPTPATNGFLAALQPDPDRAWCVA
jgi:hypothetical protein